VREHRLHPDTKARLAFWRTEMPKREHFDDFLAGLPHIETQLYYPVLDGLGILDPEVAKAEMAKAPQLRAFARKTVDSLVKEYKQAATRALGHAEFLAYVRDNKG
jgi:tryptophan halogenase